MGLPMTWIVFRGVGLMFFGLILQTRRRGQARAEAHDALRALAERRGLSFELAGQRQGARQQVRLYDHERGLSLTISPPRASRKGSTDGGSTALHLQEPVFPGGLAVYSPQLHRDLSQALAIFSGALDSGLARRMLAKVLDKDIAEGLGELQAFPPPEGISLSVLASVDPHLWFDPGAIAQAIEAGPRGRNGEERALVILNRSGLELRLTLAVTTPEAVEAFLDRGLVLQAALLRRPRDGLSTPWQSKGA